MGKARRAAGTVGAPGRLRRSLASAGRAGAPNGRVVRLRLRLTVDLLVTLAMVAFAVVSSTGYQLVRWWSRRVDRP